MRETFKTLSIFSAMLMLLLMLSTGCDVNFPGCGQFFPFHTHSLTSLNIVTHSNTPSSVTPMNQTSPSDTTTKSFNGHKLIKTKFSKTSFTKSQSAFPTPVQVDVEKIAYTTMENNQPTLWTMNTDGTDRTRLTPIGTSSWLPLWSPNGKLLAFLSNVNGGNVNLYVVNKGTDQLVQLTFWSDMPTPNPSMLQSPFTWSPTSDQLAYIYKNQIWLIQLDTKVQTTLITVNPLYSIDSIEWAPHRDNKYIAYTVRKGMNYYSVALANPRLGDNTTLVNVNQSVPAISWTSNASNLAYLSGSHIVNTISFEDINPNQVFNNNLLTLGPFVAYSPVDGSSQIMLLIKENPNDVGYKVAILTPSKSSNGPTPLKYLTSSGVDSATWSPDGTKVAYTTNGELWIVDAVNGISRKRIALTGIQSPNWSTK